MTVFIHPQVLAQDPALKTHTRKLSADVREVREGRGSITTKTTMLRSTSSSISVPRHVFRSTMDPNRGPKMTGGGKGPTDSAPPTQTYSQGGGDPNAAKNGGKGK